MNRTLMGAASAMAILLGSSALHAQTTQQQQPGTAGQPDTQQHQQQPGAQAGGETGMEQRHQEVRATIESKDEDNRELVLRLETGDEIDFGDFEEGDEVYVSFDGDRGDLEGGMPQQN